MNYIEKVFKQYPFIYFIDGRYYALGVGVCDQADGRSGTLEQRYNMYTNAQNSNITSKDAWEIFHKLKIEADFIKDNSNIHLNEITKFSNLNFTQKQIEELGRQVQCYIDYFKKYDIKSWL